MKINVVNTWEDAEIDGELYALYTAYCSNNPRLKGSGPDITSAIGTLFRNHQRQMGYRIKAEPPKNHPEASRHLDPILNQKGPWRVNDPDINGNKHRKTPRRQVDGVLVVHEGNAGDEISAHFEGAAEICTQSTPAQAIGDLILSHGAEKGITVSVSQDD